MVNIFGYPCIPEKNPTKNHPLSNKKDHKSNIDPNTKGNDGMTLTFRCCSNGYSAGYKIQRVVLIERQKVTTKKGDKTCFFWIKRKFVQMSNKLCTM